MKRCESIKKTIQPKNQQYYEDADWHGASSQPCQFNERRRPTAMATTPVATTKETTPFRLIDVHTAVAHNTRPTIIQPCVSQLMRERAHRSRHVGSLRVDIR